MCGAAPLVLGHGSAHFDCVGGNIQSAVVSQSNKHSVTKKKALRNPNGAVGKRRPVEHTPFGSSALARLLTHQKASHEPATR